MSYGLCTSGTRLQVMTKIVELSQCSLCLSEVVVTLRESRILFFAIFCNFGTLSVKMCVSNAMI